MVYQKSQIKTLFNKGNYEGHKDKINSINWAEEFNKYPNDMNKQWQFFCNVYSEAEKTYIPRKTVYVNGKMNKKLSTKRPCVRLKKKIWGKVRKDLALEEEKLQFKKNYETKSGD